MVRELKDRDGNTVCRVEKHFGIISHRSGGWTRELNLCAWNGGELKYDIRDWSEDHKKMGRGITLTEAEMQTLVEIFFNKDDEEDPDEDIPF